MEKRLEKDFENFPEVCTCKEMCKMLGNICTKTGYKLLQNRIIPSFKIGSLYFILKKDIIEYMTKKW